MLSVADAVSVVREQLWSPWQRERDRLEWIDRWYRWDQDEIRLPRRATPEMRKLAEMSKTPWLGLVVTTIAQSMFVDSYQSEVDHFEIEDKSRSPWLTWQGNDFDHRQVAIHRAALAYGYSYVTVLPGTASDGSAMSVMRGVSPRRMWAVYDEPAEDDWPTLAMQVNPQPDKTFTVRLFDAECVYYLTADSTGTAPEFIEYREHDAAVCPVVRYTNMLDLDGRADGEVEPFIPAANRINRTAFDRMLTQHFNSWKVRTVAGLSRPDSEEAANQKKMELRQDDVLVAEDPDTRFGTLDETGLDGFIHAWRADIEALAATSQTPSHNLTGQMINLSAEALAAARAPLTQKVAERQRSFGKSHVQALRLAAALEGHHDYAQDHTGRVTWQDMEIRSMAQAVDALGKAADMLGIPAEALWSRIPGVSKSDVDEWRQLVDAADPMTKLTDTLARQAPPADADLDEPPAA